MLGAGDGDLYNPLGLGIGGRAASGGTVFSAAPRFVVRTPGFYWFTRTAQRGSFTRRVHRWAPFDRDHAGGLVQHRRSAGRQYFSWQFYGWSPICYTHRPAGAFVRTQGSMIRSPAFIRPFGLRAWRPMWLGRRPRSSESLITISIISLSAAITPRFSCWDRMNGNAPPDHDRA